MTKFQTLRDDGGLPRGDAATTFFLAEGRNAAGDHFGAKSEDIMRGRRVIPDPNSIDQGGPDERTISDWLDNRAYHTSHEAFCLIPEADGREVVASGDVSLHPLERQADERETYFKHFAEARSWFARLYAPCGGREKFHRVQHGLTTRLPNAKGGIEIAVTAACLDRDMSELGCTFLHRRQVLSRVLRCSESTVNTIVKRGDRLRDKAIRLARGEAETVDADKRTVRAKRPPANNVTRLSSAESEIVVQTLVQLAISGAIEATDKRDQKQKLKMLPHSILEALDALNLNNDAMRRWLADHSADEQKQICAEWITAAVAGTPEQRAAARARINAANYSKLIRDFIRQQSSGGKRRGATSLRTKEAA